MQTVRRIALLILVFGTVPVFARQTPWPPDVTLSPETLFVSDPGSSASCWPLYVLTRGGIQTVSSAGDEQPFIDGHKSSYAIEIRDQVLYATEGTRGADILGYDLQGQYVTAVPTPSEAKDYLTFVALPGERFALLDNVNDKVFFIDAAGSLLATADIRPWADNALQNVDGVVVEGRLILSEDGYHHVLQIDLATYQVSIFKDLSGVPGHSLGAIEYAEGTYYISAGLSLYSFTETGAAVKVADVPEENITGIVVFGESAYVSVNFSGKIYKIDLTDGTVSLLASGLDYPMDLECVEDSGTTEYFELCMPESMQVADKQSECWTFMEPWLTSFPPKPTWAPQDAVVTRIEYRIVIGSTIRCADYEISLDNDPTDMAAGVVVYDNLGGLTDKGYDDDDEYDRDIELDWRQTDAFNGQSVHQNWTACFEDTTVGYTGTVKELCLRIYWEIPEDQSCCGLQPGDRVVLLTDNPRDAVGLVAGMKGTVVCCDEDDPNLPLFVSWDSWTNGRNSDSYCDTPPLSYVPYSGWWIGCQDIGFVGSGGGNGGGGASDSDLVFCVDGDCISLSVDPSAPASSNTYIGSTPVAFELNFTGIFIAKVTPISPADGTWTAWVEPDVLGPGTVTATLWVRGENLDLASLPAGGGQIQVADVQIYVAPAL
ncbi:MAG: hypothetical protein JSW66_10440 [Phycisphaerales bacterium]|nr:MAG: hypothetical protein JSW66_10440 [Phycisphaerales bacterium]